MDAAWIGLIGRTSQEAAHAMVALATRTDLPLNRQRVTHDSRLPCQSINLQAASGGSPPAIDWWLDQEQNP